MATDRATRRHAGREAQRRSAALAAPTPPPSLRTGGPLAARRMSANAGPDTGVTLPNTRAVLAGVAVGDSVAWSQVSGPGTVVFQSPNQAWTRVAASAPGTYVLRLSSRNQTGTVVAADDVVFTVAANPVKISSSSTPLDHIRTFPRPAFRRNHTLLPLQYSSCRVSPDINLELMRHWGFAGQVDEGTDYSFNQNSMVNEIKANPGMYPTVFGIASLYRVFENVTVRNPDLPILPMETYIRDAAGNLILRAGRPIVSPIAPDSALRMVGNHVGGSMRRLENETGQRFTMASYAAEAGLQFAGDANPNELWGSDPRVRSAMLAQGLNPDNVNHWWLFISRNRARQERVMKEAIYANLARGRPTAYSVYGEGFGGERGRWFGWRGYNVLWDQYLDSNGRPTVSDYASPEMYFLLHNTGWSDIHPGQRIPWDGLTQILRNAGGIISLNQKFTYPWVSQGWDSPDSPAISPDDQFIGAMKAVYTSGAIGAAVGYFTCDGPYFALRDNTAIGAATPTQIRGMINVAKVHALFTFLEPFLRDGDLLPGTRDHPYNESFNTTPSLDITTKAYEFDVVGEFATPTAENGWPDSWVVRRARVLARKMRNADRWLVTAWANTGNDRDIRVTIDPRLGEMTLRARRAGSVYIVELVDGQRRVRLIDTDPMNPTAGLFP